MLKNAVDVLIGLLIFITFILLIGVLPAWILWNALVPDLFGGPEISFLQTTGILLLVQLFMAPYFGLLNDRNKSGSEGS